jgi:hypothetical protein
MQRRRSLSSSSLTDKGQPSSWLLRLFQSEFFDTRLAVLYLHRYPHAVGVHHYICNRMKSFPEPDIEFYLPQIW